MNFEELNQEEKENKIEALKKIVMDAMMLAPNEEELNEIKNKQNKEVSRFNKNEISYDELERKLIEFGDPGGAVRTKELPELINILRIIGLDEEQVKKIVAHENDHCAKALSRGIDPIYSIQFFKIGERGEFGIYPSVNFKIPKDVPEDEKMKILKEIIGAVEELSSEDEKQLS